MQWKVSKNASLFHNINTNNKKIFFEVQYFFNDRSRDTRIENLCTTSWIIFWFYFDFCCFEDIIYKYRKVGLCAFKLRVKRNFTCQNAWWREEVTRTSCFVPFLTTIKEYDSVSTSISAWYFYKKWYLVPHIVIYFSNLKQKFFKFSNNATQIILSQLLFLIFFSLFFPFI